MNRREFLSFSALAVVAPFLPDYENPRLPLFEMRQQLEDPAFMSQFAINQFDRNQYNKKTSRSVWSQSCGAAVVAELLNVYGYFKSGVNPQVTIQNVRDVLLQNTYVALNQNKTFFEANSSMYASSVKKAIDLFGQNGHPVSTVKLPGFRIQGYDDDQFYISRAAAILVQRLPLLFQLAEQEVFSKGGVLVAFVYNYGGHFVVISSAKPSEDPANPQVLVMDSRGKFARYFRFLDYVANMVDGTEGLISVFGVVPK